MRYRLLVLVLHLCIFLVLAFGYENFIATLYAYQGYEFLPNAANGYIALATVAALSLLTPVGFQRPSTLFFQFTLIFVLMPMLVLFYAEDKNETFMAEAVAAYVFSIVLASLLKIKPPGMAFISEERLLHVLLFVLFVYIATVFLLGGGAYFNFDFSKVYDFRDEAANNLPSTFGYLSPLMAKVIVPIGLVLSVLHRKYFITALYLVCAFIVFGLTSHKATVLNPLLVLFVYAASSSRTLIAKFSAGILVLLLLSMADFHFWIAAHQEDGLFGWVGSLVLGRTFILPAEINYMYYDFFTRNDWVWFSDSKITLGLLEFQYPLDVAHMIGREYFNSDHAGANTGWIGSGYAQAGFAGMLLYAAITAVMYKYVDACAFHSGERRLITASILIPISSLITSSDLPTTLLTHGLLLNLVLIACFRGGRVAAADPPARQRAMAY